ncbi:MAG: OmpH family outer membrane protein, partial [Bacteroidota bacterium]
GLNIVLTLAVLFLFYKVYQPSKQTETEESKTGESKLKAETKIKTQMPSNAPTGKIVFVNIDRLNEESAEITDLVKESTQRKNAIESSIANLSNLYQKKVEDYQTSAKAGIAPASEMQNKEREIMSLQKEAENKQMQMDNLSLDLNDKNAAFQKTVRDFLIKWNQGRYDYVISYSETVPTMLLGNASLEITDEVIAALNAEYKIRKSKK